MQVCGCVALTVLLGPRTHPTPKSKCALRAQHIVHTLATDGNSPLPHISDACPFFEVDRTWSAAPDSPDLAEGVQSKHAQIGRRIFNSASPRLDHVYVYISAHVWGETFGEAPCGRWRESAGSV